MTDSPIDSVTALVMMRAAATGSPHSGAPIERANLASVAPDERDVEAVAVAMHGLGFEVGPMVGVSMSITASQANFESVFGVSLDHHDGNWQVHQGDAHDGASGSHDVPCDRLGSDVAGRIERVVFEPPRDLHDGPSWH